MRTLLHACSTFEVGGAQTRLAQIANHFGRKYRHLVVAMDGKTEALAHFDDNVDVELLSIPVKRGRTLGNIGPFRDMLRDINPDLLLTYNWGAIDWALSNMMARRPHLHLEDGFGPQETERQLPRRVWIRRLFLRQSTTLLPSRVLHRIALDQWRLPEKNLVYVPNGIDCDRFARAPDWDFAARFGIPRGEFIVGSIAGLRPEKNLARLVEAFALVAQRRPARLVLIGDGDERPALTAQAAALGLADRVIFTGNSKVPEKLLSCFDVFAMSSNTEQMPISLIEAMAAGRPAAATDVGDIINMVTPDNRPYVVPRDATRLAEAIIDLMNKPELAARIGAANARRAREEYAEQRMFDSYEKLFDGDVARR